MVPVDSLDFYKFEWHDHKTFLGREVSDNNHDYGGKRDTVAPALQPVNTDRFWVIFDSPVRLMYVWPQKSLAALEEFTISASNFQ